MKLKSLLIGIISWLLMAIHAHAVEGPRWIGLTNVTFSIVTLSNITITNIAITNVTVTNIAVTNITYTNIAITNVPLGRYPAVDKTNQGVHNWSIVGPSLDMRRLYGTRIRLHQLAFNLNLAGWGIETNFDTRRWEILIYTNAVELRTNKLVASYSYVFGNPSTDGHWFTPYDTNKQNYQVNFPIPDLDLPYGTNIMALLHVAGNDLAYVNLQTNRIGSKIFLSNEVVGSQAVLESSGRLTLREGTQMLVGWLVSFLDAVEPPRLDVVAVNYDTNSPPNITITLQKYPPALNGWFLWATDTPTFTNGISLENVTVDTSQWKLTVDTNQSSTYFFLSDHK